MKALMPRLFKVKPDAQNRISSRNGLADLLAIRPNFIEAVSANPARYYGQMEIPRRDGGMRIIHPPRKPLRQAQRTLLNALYRRLRIPPYLHGGIPQKSIFTHARVHVGRQMVATLDVRAFFPSTTAAHVEPVLRAAGLSDEALSDALALTMLDNALPQGSPTSSLLVSPAAPDGENGYYRTRPSFSLSARDAESYVREIDYRVGDGAATTYAAPVALPEGTNQVVYWSLDSTGWRETDKIASFQVDLGAPAAEGSLAGILGNEGVYLSCVGVSLSAADTVSGVDWIEYQLGTSGWQRYTGPLSITEEGSWTVLYRAKDRAGNLSEQKRLSFSIDLGVPLVAAHQMNEPGLTVLYLEAVDTGSGVRSLEYGVDGGGVQQYRAPIVLTAVGTHVVLYRAGDAAGQYSGWQSVSADVVAYTPGRLVKDLVFAYWRPGREVVESVQVGAQLYGPSDGIGDPDDYGNRFSGNTGPLN